MAIIRMKLAKKVIPVAQALVHGGITALEVTLNTPRALALIEELNNTLGADIIVGAGTVTSKKACLEAVKAGAQFIVTPVTETALIEVAHQYEAPVFMGAMTPTEIHQAYEAGADVIKVFPAHALGMAYFRAVAGPLPHIPLMPTGGVSLDNAEDWIKSGAQALGVGGGLLDKKAIETEDYQVLTERARQMLKKVSEVRNPS